MPRDGYFFDTIVRQEPIDDDALNPEDNLEEFQPIADEDIGVFPARGRRRGGDAAAPSWRTSAAPRSAISRSCPRRF